MSASDKLVNEVARGLLVTEFQFGNFWSRGARHTYFQRRAPNAQPSGSCPRPVQNSFEHNALRRSQGPAPRAQLVACLRALGFQIGCRQTPPPALAIGSRRALPIFRRPGHPRLIGGPLGSALARCVEPVLALGRHVLGKARTGCRACNGAAKRRVPVGTAE